MSIATLDILLLEPFYGGSHRQWADGLRRTSRHRIEMLTLPARHWKWRMHGAAVTLAQRYLARAVPPDLLLATDMLDVATFLGLIARAGTPPPLALYMHENQLTYPWSPTDPDPAQARDRHYGWTNYTSALAADRVFFNSNYHREGFLSALRDYLRVLPDHRTLDNLDPLTAKSETLPLALDLGALDVGRSPRTPGPPRLLWNHRWEYDKRPDLFFAVCRRLRANNLDFRLIVLGQKYRHSPAIFAQAKDEFQDIVLHWGYAESLQEYSHWLWQADILPVTGVQDFFGGSVVEAIYCQTYPLLPNRLAYPEHLPTDLRKDHLYEDDELFSRLSRLLQNQSLPPGHHLSAYVTRYDWQQLSPVYDKIWQHMANGRN